jgi:conjugative transfer region protein TrbK
VDIKLLARIGAVAFIAVVLIVTAIQMREPRKAPEPVESTTIVAAPADPLADEMVHCQSIGQAGASDPGCLAAWAENRRRFLSPGARPQARLPELPAQSGAAR